MDRDDQIASLFARWKSAAPGVATLTPEELCRDCPELLDDFRARLPLLQAVDALFDPESNEASAEGINLEAEGFSSLTFFRQGGLGVVLLGEETGLKRPVAVKKLKPVSARNPASRQRFIAEAEITARLEHPGIVPIYRVGHDSQGHPFYAMRFVEGETLSEAISRFYESVKHGLLDRPLEFRRLIRCIAAVCQTVAYAHSRGVIHRDLKPDNVMLGPFGEVLVLDWGLAKTLHDPAPATDEPTDPNEHPVSPSPLPEHSIDGRAKGAPGFMSPEQASGNWPAVTEATDIYGLGAILYVALTGRSPYSGRSAQEVISQVIQAPPVSPLRLNPVIGPALSAICQKAMARERDERYTTAQDLADDLERWMADEPISVYREPLTNRIRRWMRRHRSLVTGGAAAAVMLFLGVVLLAIQERRNADRERAANEKTSLAYTRLRQAAVVFMSSAMGELSSPEMHQALSDIRDHLEVQSGTSAHRLYELAAIDNAEGALYLRSNEGPLAMACFERALQGLEEGRQLEPGNREFQTALAVTWLNLGSGALMQDRPADALGWIEKGLAAVEKLNPASRDPGSSRPELEWKLKAVAGQAYWKQANFQWVAGEFAAADESFEQARRLHDELVSAVPELPGVREDQRLNLLSFGKFLQNQGITAFQHMQFSDSVREFERALKIWDELTLINPADVEVGRHLRHVCSGLASACQQRSRELASQAKETPGDSGERRRILQLGLAAIDRLPSFTSEAAEMAPIRTDLVRNLEELKTPP